MKEITKQQLIELLKNTKTATPATIITQTIPQMRKKNNPYLDKVTKFMKANVFINFNYEKSVNRVREKEGITDEVFVAKPRVWGVKIQGTPLVEHKGNYYLECRFLKHCKSTYLFENKVLDESIISDFIYEGSNAENQGVFEEVILRDFKIESILQIKFNKEVYIIR